MCGNIVWFTDFVIFLENEDTAKGEKRLFICNKMELFGRHDKQNSFALMSKRTPLVYE